MKIKNDLVFNKHSGQLGSVNADIKKDGSVKTLANHAFVFLARAVFKPTIGDSCGSLLQYIPFSSFYNTISMQVYILYPVHVHACMGVCYNVICISYNYTHAGEKIFPIVWEVIKSLELYGILVTSLTSEGAKPNRRFYHLCQPQVETCPKNVSTYREDKDHYFFSDAPHLLKTTRNCFSNSFSHSRSRYYN